MSSLRERLAAQRQQIAQKAASFERAYKFKPGKTTLLILPGVKNPDDFYKLYGAHYIKDIATDKVVAVVGDAGITYGQADPVRSAIGELSAKAAQRGDEVTATKMKKWLARESYVINALVVAGDDENKGKVVRPEFSMNTFNDILSKIEDGMEAEVIVDMSKGVLLIMERTGLGQTDTRYSPSLSLKQPPEAPKQEWLDARIDLDDYVAGKFGQSVAQALQHLSVLLGRDVTTTALGMAIAETAALAAPAAAPAPSASPAPATSSIDDELMALDEEPVVEAEFEPAAAPAAKPDEMEDILAELDAL